MKYWNQKICLCLILAIFLSSIAPKQLILANEFMLSDDSKGNVPEYIPIERCGLEQITVIFENEQKENNVISQEERIAYSEAEAKYWKKFSSDYYYNQLDETGKAIWDGLEASCIGIATSKNYYECATVSFTNNDNLTWDEITEISNMFKFSNPQYYFLESYLSIGSTNDLYYVKIKLYDDLFDGEIRKIATENFTDKIDNWVSQIGEMERDEDKLKKAYDILIQNVEYDYQYESSYNQSAYSVVVDGLTVCAGYAAMLQILLNANGVETIEVISEDHGWNLVNLHGFWYVADATWDDAGGFASYWYYAKSEDTLSRYDESNSHDIISEWLNYTPELKYDAVSGNAYLSTYFTKDNNIYFRVNDNEKCAEYCVKIIDIVNDMITSTIPQYVSFNNVSYLVLDYAPDLEPEKPEDGEFVDGIISNDEYGIPDKNFYDTALKDYDSNGDGVLTKSEAATTEKTSLDLTMDGIQNIQGIQYFNPQFISLSYNEITDISPLNQMQNRDMIRGVFMDYNNISNISALSRLSGLRQLSISGNKISDISPLVNLNLKELDISSNKITDISCLKSSALLDNFCNYANDKTNSAPIVCYYSNPDYLNNNIILGKGNRISYEQVRDVIPEELLNYKVRKYNEETGEFDILTDITWESTQEFYSQVTITPNDFEDVNLYAAIVTATSPSGIKYDADGDGIISSTELDNITYLNLQDENITSLEGIQKLTKLTGLAIDKNPIEDISPLKDMDLQLLGLSYTNIDNDDLKVINNIHTLKTLDIDGNNLSDISSLKGLYLNSISAQYNKISDIRALEGMPLNIIQLNDNLISDVSPLANLGEAPIESLHLFNNNIRYLASLKDSKFSKNIINGITINEWVVRRYDEETYSTCYNIFEGNEITQENALENLPKELLDAKVYKRNASTGNYELSEETYYEAFKKYLKTEVEDIDPVEAFVRRMYTEALGREYDTAGCAFWTNSLKEGTRDGVTVARQFLTSNELVAQNLSNEEFISRLYATFFDREEPTTSTGFKFWMNYLENGVSRKFVIRGFAHSAEFTAVCNNYGITRGNMVLTDNSDQNANVTMYVFRCYDRVLGRTPDASGLNYWTGEINKKTKNPIKVAEQVVFSKEFLAKNVDNETYIRILYNMFFDREADANGLKFWLEEMNSGRRDRYKVLTQFANSAEFKAVLKTFGW